MNAGRGPEDLPEIMGFRWNTKLRNGGSQAWKQYLAYAIQQEAVAHVINRLRQHPTETIYDACEYARTKILEKWGVKSETDTIQDWYKAHNK